MKPAIRIPRMIVYNPTPSPSDSTHLTIDVIEGLGFKEYNQMKVCSSSCCKAD